MAKFTPKTGEECEVYHPLNEYWYLVTITAETDLNYVVIKRNESHEYLLEKSLNKFRPIRTQEDIERGEAIETLQHVILDHWNENGEDCPILENHLARYLHGKGYRLVGEKVVPEEIARFLMLRDGDEAINELCKRYDIYKRKV